MCDFVRSSVLPTSVILEPFSNTAYESPTKLEIHGTRETSSSQDLAQDLLILAGKSLCPGNT